jgi:hypothetical protein
MGFAVYCEEYRLVAESPGMLEQVVPALTVRGLATR